MRFSRRSARQTTATTTGAIVEPSGLLHSLALLSKTADIYLIREMFEEADPQLL